MITDLSLISYPCTYSAVIKEQDKFIKNDKSFRINNGVSTDSADCFLLVIIYTNSLSKHVSSNPCRVLLTKR